MRNNNREWEDELKKRMSNLEKQRGELEEYGRKIWQQEEDEEFELTMSNRALEQMEVACSPNDKVILQLIAEKQQVIQEIRNNKAEFATEMEEELKKKRQQLEWEMEEVQMQLVSVRMQQEEKDDEKQSDTEERDGEGLDDRK